MLSRRRIFLATCAALVLALGAALLACSPGPVRRPDGGDGHLPVGAAAPDFEAETSTGKLVRLSSMRGNPVVVYFYPMDGTPGCTAEACAFRDVWKRFSDASVGVIGVSSDDRESHREFVAEHALPFPLAADESGSIAASYGVGSILGMYERVSFLVGPDGRVAKVWPDVDPGVHALEVLEAAQALR